MIKKIQLIIPPNTAIKIPNQLHYNINKNFPLGIGYLASYLEQEDYEVQAVDALVEGWSNVEEISKNKIKIGLSDTEIINKINSFSPDIVGISSLFTMQTENVFRLAKLVKQVDRKIIVIVGGANASVIPEVLIQNENIDFVVMGEGEYRFLALIKAIEKGKQEINNIDGIAYKENGNSHLVPNRNFIEDLDCLPFPARHLFNMEMYFDNLASHGTRKYRRFASLISSRGCPMKCIFCNAYKTWGRKYRMRSPENVISEIEQLITKYNIRELLFEDDNLTMHKKRAERIFDMMIAKKFNLVWDTPNGVAVNALDENLIQKMKESGCYHLNIAIESGSQRVLKEIINKPIDLKRVSDLITFSKKIGLSLGGFFIFGMPGETIKEMQETIHFIKKNKFNSVHLAIASPLPGSALYELCKDRGFLNKEFTPYSPPIIDYYIETPDWSSAELRDFIEKEKLKIQVYQQIINPKDMVGFLKKGPMYVMKKSLKLLEQLLK